MNDTSPDQPREAASFVARLLVAAVLPLATAAPAAAQEWPARPIRLVTPYTPGGALDIIARRLGVGMSQAWGQQVVVDNRPGANSNIGSEIVARAAPDGYTLLIAGIANTINPALYKLSFDPERDLAAVVLVASVPGILAANPGLRVRTVAELVTLAKAKPGVLAYSSTGAGGAHHLAGEMFSQAVGVKLVHIPYKGAAPALADVIGGQVPILFGNLLSVVPHTRAGRLQALAVASAKRSPAATEIPTLVESGVPVTYGSWSGLMAPAKTPAAIIAKVNREAVRILGLADVRDRLAADGAEIVAGTPEEFAAFFRTEMVQWAKVVKAAGIRIE
jgi:tripartite-type tricarboxylate transporter receptor subunit TctC